MILLNSIQTTILESLGAYTYLSALQVQTLTGHSLGYIRSQLAVLKQRKFIKSYHVEITAKVRAQSIYYMTELGLSCLALHEKTTTEMKYPLSHNVQIIRDYEHRKRFIDLQIALQMHFRKATINLLLFFKVFRQAGKC